MADLRHEQRARRTKDGTRHPEPRRLSSVQVAQLACRDLVEITGLQSEGVTSLERDDDGIWDVTVELLEFSRIPNSDDVLGSYRASVDASGELLGYRRVRRYARSRSLQDA
jgi:Gas vesicle synthesis protein GvpO